MIMPETIMIVGYGAMAQAIARGLNGKCRLEICGRDYTKAQELISTLNIHNATAVSLQTNSDQTSLCGDIAISSPVLHIQDKVVLLCVKPYGLGSFHYIGYARAVYSVLAGVSIADIGAHLNARAYIRLMPNIAAVCGLSATTAFCVNANRDQVRAICSTFGSVVFVDNEKLIDSSIATSGSSPAFLALIAQALVDSGVRSGLSRADSLTLVRETLVGVGALLSRYAPQELIDRVTTPGGTTIEGLAILESNGVRGAIMQACQASVNKAIMTSATGKTKEQQSSRNIAVESKPHPHIKRHNKAKSFIQAQKLSPKSPPKPQVKRSRIDSITRKER